MNFGSGDVSGVSCAHERNQDRTVTTLDSFLFGGLVGSINVNVNINACQNIFREFFVKGDVKTVVNIFLVTYPTCNKRVVSSFI